MSQVKYYIESSLISKTEVNPIFKGIFTFVQEEDKLYHIHKCKEKIKFINEDYELIMQHKDNECEDISIIVEIACADEYEHYWQGKFKIFDTTRDDPKYLEVIPQRDGIYECFEEALKDKQNIYSENATDYVTVYSGHGEREIIECVSDTKSWSAIGSITGLTSDPYPNQDNFTLPDYPSDCVDGETGFFAVARELHITLEETRIHDTLGTYTYIEYILLSRYMRWQLTLPCVGGVPTPPSYPSGLIVNGQHDVWPLYSDDCAATGTATFGSLGFEEGPYTRGRVFNDILIQAVGALNCGLTVQSNFFNINPDGNSPDNIAYQFAEDYLWDLTIHQKSDIKRKEASNPAKELSWEIENKQLFGDLRKAFNVWPIIKNNVLHLEHYSHFVGELGWDVSDKNISTVIDYSGNSSIQTENFYYMDEACSALFKAQEVRYNCGTENKDYRCEMFSFDVSFIENINNEAEIDDGGFVLISNTIRDGQYIMNRRNIFLRWELLLENLHVFGRLYKSGKLNGVQQDFISWKPYIKSDPFTLDYCCGDLFDPAKLMTTKLGQGTVKEAEHNVYKNTLKPKLFY